jgi:uncharacterized protein YlbG (UPF0298 family)
VVEATTILFFLKSCSTKDWENTRKTLEGELLAFSKNIPEIIFCNQKKNVIRYSLRNYKNKNMRKGKNFGDVRYRSSNLMKLYSNAIQCSYIPFHIQIEKFIHLNCSNKPNLQRSIKGSGIYGKKKKLNKTLPKIIFCNKKNSVNPFIASIKINNTYVKEIKCSYL